MTVVQLLVEPLDSSSRMNFEKSSEILLKNINQLKPFECMYQPCYDWTSISKQSKQANKKLFKLKARKVKQKTQRIIEKILNFIIYSI